MIFTTITNTNIVMQLIVKASLFLNVKKLLGFFVQFFNYLYLLFSKFKLSFSHGIGQFQVSKITRPNYY